MRPDRPLTGFFAGTVVALLAAALLAGCGDDDEAKDGKPDGQQLPEFGYSGAKGPSHWGSLDPAYVTCSAGRRQSPIDLRDGKRAKLPPIDFSYQSAEVVDENNGHSVEATYPAGSSIVLGGRRFDLEQFHYHAPSEHELKGRSFPLEFHFVHKAVDGSVAVLGVFAEEGRANPAFSDLAEALPRKEGEELSVEGEVDVLALLPPDPATAPRWAYLGSLTTPPCSQPVRWNVYSEPIELSKAQIADYTAVYDDTNRPLQPHYNRELLVSR